AAAMKVHVLDQVVVGHESGKGIALQQITLMTPQEGGMSLGLHTLSHHFQGQVVSQGNDARGDGSGASVLDHIFDERTVYLDLVGGHQFDVAEAGEPSAKVINGNANTHVT